MSTVDYKAIEAEAVKAGLTVENFGGGHLRFIGGVTTVDWWPESKRRTACAFGYRGHNYANVHKVIQMTTIALPPLPPKPAPTEQEYLDSLQHDMDSADHFVEESRVEKALALLREIAQDNTQNQTTLYSNLFYAIALLEGKV